MSKDFLKKIFGRAIGLGFNQGKPTSYGTRPRAQLIVPGGFEAGGDGRPTIVFPGPDTVAVFEDFHSSSDTGSGTDAASKIRQGYWIKGFSDTGQTVPATGIVGTSVSALTNGLYRMTPSATSAQDPVAGAMSINSPPGWKANQGGLRGAVRLKTSVLAGTTVFAGFTDTGGTEIAAYDTGGGILTPASNYAGIIWSGEAGATQQAYRAVTGKADVDQNATTGVTPVTNTFSTLEIEISQDGAKADFWIDGVPRASIPAGAITATTALSFGVWAANTDGAANPVDVDWINISAARDTGT